MGGMAAGGMGIEGQEDFDRPKVYYICGGKQTDYVTYVKSAAKSNHWSLK